MPGNKELKASVIIPVFNEEKAIDACMESIMRQTCDLHRLEFLIIDGMSTDGTRMKIQRYMERYPDLAIRLLENPDRITPKSLNIGIRNAKGEYIVRLDAHSEYHPDYLQKCIEFMDAHPQVDNVGGIAITKSHGYIGNAIAKVLSSSFGVGNSNFRINGREGSVDTVPFGCFRKTVFDSIGLFNEKLLRSEDNDINARIIQHGGTVWLDSEIKFIYHGRDTIIGLLKMAVLNGNALFWTLKENRNAMSIRHFIPFFFTLSLILLPLFSWIRPVLDAFILEAALYTALNVYFSFVKPEAKYGFLTVFLFPLFHISYGLGSILSLLGVKLY